ncbi:hypothetical protein YC2023_063567 [Brassica napus]
MSNLYPASLLSGHTRIRQWGTLLLIQGPSMRGIGVAFEWSDNQFPKEKTAHQNERQVPPEKLHRAALLKNQYADLILKARERKKARLQAEAKEAEEARRKAEAEAANWNLKEKQPAKLCLS